MATTRIKDLSKTATTVNSDANLVLDGNTGGTQKISRDNFRQDTADAFVAAPGTYNLAPLNSGTGKIDAVYLSSSSDTPKGAWDASTNTPTLADGSGTAGDYYDVTVAGSSDLGSGSIAFTVGDVVKYNGTVWFKIDSVANILDGVSTIDGAKTAIEIPDVGTAPNEVPLNGQLGSMAYQSADSVSIASAEVETLEVTDKVAGPLTVSNTSAATSFILANSGGGTTLNFAVTENTGGIIDASEGASARNILFKTGGAERWRINSSGNLVANGTAIDFGSTTTGTGTVTGGLLNDYEFGDFTVTAGGAWTVTPTSMGGRYVKVGNLVTCWVTFGGSPSKTSATSGWLEGLPFATNVYPGQGSVSDTSVVDRGNCYAANVNRLWLTGTSFGVNSYATVTYRHD